MRADRHERCGRSSDALVEACRRLLAFPVHECTLPANGGSSDCGCSFLQRPVLHTTDALQYRRESCPSRPRCDLSASAQVEVPAHIRGGSDLIFKIKLNEAIPEEARFDVRLSPVTADQEITVSSGDPANRERTEFFLKARLPEKAVPGEWHIKIVYLFLAGTSWTNNTLATNPDFRFVVEGPKVEIPTKATASLVNDQR